MSAQNQFLCMISNTALPGCRNCAFARLLVWVDTKTPVPEMILSCSSSGVLALNSTIRTYSGQILKYMLSANMLYFTR